MKILNGAAGNAAAITGGVAFMLALGMSDMANAGNGKGKGGENSSSNSSHNSSKGGNGAIASELKWRNSAHASEQALLNASENGRPGQWRVYKGVVQTHEDAKTVLDGKQDYVNYLAGLTADQRAIEFGTWDGEPGAEGSVLLSTEDEINGVFDTEWAIAVGERDLAAGEEATAADERDGLETEMGISDLSPGAFDHLMALLGF